MAALNYFGGVPSVYVTGSREDMESMINDESTQLLADAIKRMDGLIGDYNYMYVSTCVCAQAKVV